MGKKRILIVENLYGEFQSVKVRLDELFQDQIEVLPHDTVGTDYHDHDMLIDAFKTGETKFQEIFGFFEHVDLYILDVSLKGDQDHLGIEFFEFLKKASKLQFKTIFISQSAKGKLPLPEDGSFDFVSKRDYGLREFPNQVASKVADVFDLNF